MKQLTASTMLTAKTKLKEPTGIREAIALRQAPPIGPVFITVKLSKSGGEDDTSHKPTIRRNVAPKV